MWCPGDIQLPKGAEPDLALNIAMLSNSEAFFVMGRAFFRVLIWRAKDGEGGATS